MLLVMSPNPAKLGEREGYWQKVAAIDIALGDEKKVYLGDIESQSDAARLLAEADTIYIHSIFQAEKIISIYPLVASRVILDLHGVVPEESELIGDIELSKRMSVVEEVVFRYTKRFVAVTNAMAKYYTKKYHLGDDVKWIILPMIEVSPRKITAGQNKDNLIVYAGGTQRWQNINIILDIINVKYDKYRFLILTHNPDGFKRIDARANEKVTIKTVESDDIARYYAKAKFGFILRDDTAVNAVACPAKLVEYMCNGVVPIVLSPKIGDFIDLDYGYIEVGDFVAGNIEENEVSRIVEVNHKVVHRLNKQVQQGTARLRKLLLIDQDDDARKPDRTTIENALEWQHYQNSIRLTLQEVVADKDRRLEVYGTQVEVYNQQINSIISSRRWKIASALARPLSSLKKDRNI